MIELDIPGFKPLRLEHAVLDYNGTIALDGAVLPGVVDRLAALREHLDVHIVTADTHGSARRELGENTHVTVLTSNNHPREKRDFVASLGSDRVVAIGNGRNDAAMLEEAAVGIAVCQAEGASTAALQAADVVCGSVCDALDLLRFPKRLLATLRS